MSVGVKYKPGHRTPKMLLLPSPHAAPTEGLVPRAPALEREKQLQWEDSVLRLEKAHVAPKTQRNQKRESLFHKTILNKWMSAL